MVVWPYTRYLEFLRYAIIPDLLNVCPDIYKCSFNRMINLPFMQHLSLHILMFPACWIMWRGTIEWPTRLPDSLPLDFFLCGYSKSKYTVVDWKILYLVSCQNFLFLIAIIVFCFTFFLVTSRLKQTSIGLFLNSLYVFDGEANKQQQYSRWGLTKTPTLTHDEAGHLQSFSNCVWYMNSKKFWWKTHQLSTWSISDCSATQSWVNMTVV